MGGDYLCNAPTIEARRVSLFDVASSVKLT